MKDLGAKTMMFPMPVLILGTYDENGKADAMNAAWGGIADDNQVWVCMSKRGDNRFWNRRNRKSLRLCRNRFGQQGSRQN